MGTLKFNRKERGVMHIIAQASPNVTVLSGADTHQPDGLDVTLVHRATAARLERIGLIERIDSGWALTELGREQVVMQGWLYEAVPS